MSDTRVSFPIDLGKGFSVTEENAKTYYQHTERDVPRGFFPLGHNTVWHGGVHIYANEGAAIQAMFDGVVVAARLSADAEAATGPYGSTNFIVVKHTFRGDAINTVQDGNHTAWDTFDLYSVYMHVGFMDLEAGNADLGAIGWLTKPLETEIEGSVGRGGRNKKADVELVQTLLTKAGIDPGPIDGAIGSKTIGAIETLQDTYLYSNPDGRIDVGGSSWAALCVQALGTPAEDGIDEDLLGKLGEGAVVAPGKRIRGGQQLWVVGPDAPESSTFMFQWEVISSEKVFLDFKEVVDEAQYTGNPTVILQKLGGTSWINGEVTGSAIAEFFASNAQAPLLREFAVKFRSEWAADGAAMVEALQERFFVEGLDEAVAPYAWMNEAGEAELPEPLHYHYNPIRVAELINDMDFKRELPPPPPPPPPEEDDPADDVPTDEETPVPDADEILMYDAGTDLIYAVDKATFAKLCRENDKLAAKRNEFEKAIKAAKGKPLDQRINAVKPTLKELEKLTGVKAGGSPHEPPQAFVREYWYRNEDGGMKMLYLGEKQFDKVSNKLNGSKLKNLIKMKGAEPHPAAKKGARAQIDLIDHTFFKDEGSLLDFIDSASPSILTYMLGPVAGADMFFEQFPRIFRKGVGGKWESPDGHFAASAEAKFLRFSYQSKVSSMIDPLRGKADAKIGIGGSVSLLEGKAGLDAFLPNKNGFALPVTEGDDLKCRFKFFGEVSGFAGGVAELSAGAAIAWKPQVEEDDDFMGVRAEAGLEAFVGVKVQGKVGVAVEWFNPDPKIKKWNVLAEFSAGITAAAGIGITAKFYLDFDAAAGAFKFYAKLEVVLKVGMGKEFVGLVKVAEILDFLWQLLTRADWGYIAEMSLKAFLEASKMMVGAAIMGVTGPVGLGIYLITNFWSWWDDQGKITDLAENILNNKAPYLLEKGTPEAKGMAIYRLTQASWMWDETSETASLKVLKTAKNKREAEKILKSIDPDGRSEDASPTARRRARTVKRGYDLLSGLVDWSEQTELDEYLTGLGINYS